MGAEYVEARVLIPSDKVDEFLEFCQEHLGSMPAVHRVPPAANGHEVIEEIEAKAAQKLKGAKRGKA